MSKFGAETTALEVVEGVDLTGKDFIVTGGSAGIGVETVRALAHAGARVVIGARDIAKAEGAVKKIRESGTTKGVIEIEKLQLDSLASVNDFVKRYLDKKRPLHCLINNAGVMLPTRTLTEDGFEVDFGTNHIGHFALTIGLVPALVEAYKQTGKKSRVVNVSSTGHAFSDVVFDDINFSNREFDLMLGYGQSKTANILFSVALTHFYSDQGIVSNALMPGGIHTELSRNVPKEVIEKFFSQMPQGFKLKTTEQGASTTVWVAVAEELDGVGGQYFENCGYSKICDAPTILKEFFGHTAYSVDKDNAIKLWNLSQEYLKNPPK